MCNPSQKHKPVSQPDGSHLGQGGFGIRKLLAQPYQQGENWALCTFRNPTYGRPYDVEGLGYGWGGPPAKQQAPSPAEPGCAESPDFSPMPTSPCSCLSPISLVSSCEIFPGFDASQTRIFSWTPQ